jgi:hypothetical protein
MSRPITDWLSRVTIPDVYPRRDDPFQPGGAVIPLDAPGPSMISPGDTVSTDIYNDWVTTPGVRPVVYQRALNFSVNVTAVPQPIAVSGQFQCDSMVISVPTGGNSVFFGYGSGISSTSGIEIKAGVPLALTADNDREQWELQRVLEAFTAMMAADRGYQPLGLFRAPRVVFDANGYFLVCAAGLTQTVGIMLFNIPELQ